jgi:hypothetical protein
MDPGAGTMATSFKRQATSSKLQAASLKLQDTKVQITQPEGLRQNEAASCGKLSQRQSVMLTAKLTQEPGILTQASSDKLRHNASVKQNLPVRKYLLTNQQKG